MREAVPALGGAESSLDDEDPGAVIASTRRMRATGERGADAAPGPGAPTRASILDAAHQVRHALLARLASAVPGANAAPPPSAAGDDVLPCTTTPISTGLGDERTTPARTASNGSELRTTATAECRARNEEPVRGESTLDDLALLVDRLESAATSRPLDAMECEALRQCRDALRLHLNTVDRDHVSLREAVGLVRRALHLMLLSPESAAPAPPPAAVPARSDTGPRAPELTPPVPVAALPLVRSNVGRAEAGVPDERDLDPVAVAGSDCGHEVAVSHATTPADAAEARGTGRDEFRRTIVGASRFAGVALILLVVYAVFGTAVLEGRAQRSMSAESHIRVTSPDTGLDSLVVAGDSRSALGKGPGFAPGLDAPGGNRPVMIVGHRVGNGAPFRHLSALRPGTRVTLRRGDGPAYVYAVERAITTTPRASIAEPVGTQVLLLVSATPPYHDSRRLVVVARLMGGAQVGAQQTRLPALGGSPFDLVLGAALLALISCGWGVWRVRVRAAPVWARGAALISTAIAVYVMWGVLLGAASRVL